MATSNLKMPFLLSLTILLLISCDTGILTSEKESSKADATSIERTATIESSNHTPTQANVNHALAQVRRATSKYNNLRAATADGYAQFSVHVPHMGIHYLHSSNVNADATSNLDNTLDIMNPEILVYLNKSGNSPQQNLVAVEYAIPADGASPPAHALNLFPGLEASDWHIHPSTHGLPVGDDWTMHGECHYQGGPGVFLAEDPSGNFVYFAPPTGPFGSWSGTVEPGQCPSELAGGIPLPPLMLAHGNWWTLHAWVWYPNPEGMFHATNPRVPVAP